MTICSLTTSKVLTAKKRKKPYIIRDQKLKGFHLKIYPSGRKNFAITCLRGGKQYNERIGDAAVMTLADARRIAASNGEETAVKNRDLIANREQIRLIPCPSPLPHLDPKRYGWELKISSEA